MILLIQELCDRIAEDHYWAEAPPPPFLGGRKDQFRHVKGTVIVGEHY